jgi:hypothetical protein
MTFIIPDDILTASEMLEAVKLEIAIVLRRSEVLRLGSDQGFFKTMTLWPHRFSLG